MCSSACVSSLTSKRLSAEWYFAKLSATAKPWLSGTRALGKAAWVAFGEGWQEQANASELSSNRVVLFMPRGWLEKEGAHEDIGSCQGFEAG